MKALIQRVSSASVSSQGQLISAIDHGMLVLLGIEATDTRVNLQNLAHKVCHYRLFSDNAGKMNLNIQQSMGAMLVVSQFTLAADTKNGLRPSFTLAAAPALAQQYYLEFIDACRALGVQVSTGRFGADMQVSLVNDGPVTFMLQC